MNWEAAECNRKINVTVEDSGWDPGFAIHGFDPEDLGHLSEPMPFTMAAWVSTAEPGAYRGTSSHIQI